MNDTRLLATYLNNHLTGANAGVALFHRAASQHEGTDLGHELAALADEVESDRASLRRIMDDLGITENLPMTMSGKLAELLGRFKPNGYVVRRSPLSDVIELEALRDAVAAKSSGWQVLRAVAGNDPRIDREEIERLIDRAAAQAEELHRMHLQVTAEQLTG